jgi:hypothetical protein
MDCAIPVASTTNQTGVLFTMKERNIPFCSTKVISVDQKHIEQTNNQLTKNGVCPNQYTQSLQKITESFLTQLPERKEIAQGFHHEANGEFKTVTESNGCDRRKLRLDQQHWRYITPQY